ncbi:MAG: hypothetical protein EOO11_03115 [Chitinophagaceae bacterium]|nr:MAG: hypothetical protein EOO11_03115 [Chitinophagaceae bacterium]
MTRLLLVLGLLLAGIAAEAQTDTANRKAATGASLEPPFKRLPGLPPIDLLLADSSTVFTSEQVKKKPVLLMLFDPECHHCQVTAEELYRERNTLRHVQVVMATMATVPAMRAFRERYHLDEVPQVLVGKDRYYLLPPFFNVTHLPFMALYNRRHQLAGSYEGGIPIPKAVALLTGKQD